MSTQVEMKSLSARVREITTEADAKDAAEAGARRAKAQSDLISNLRARFDVDVDLESVVFESHEADWAIVRVEEFEFGVMIDDDWERGLVLLRRCSTCNGFSVRSAGSVEDLAFAIRCPVGYPHGSGDCAKKTERQQTAELRLLSALRDFIAENSYQPQ